MIVVVLYLDKEWNGVESSDDDSVVHIPGQDVERPCASLHNLLHAHALLREGRTNVRGTAYQQERGSTCGPFGGFGAPQTAAGFLPCWCVSGCPGGPGPAAGPGGGWPPARAERCDWPGTGPGYGSDRRSPGGGRERNVFLVNDD